MDKKVISVFEISPFDDKVSKEFQIGCEVGDFKLGKVIKLQRHFKALDTFGYCQRPVFSLGACQHYA